MDLNIIIAFRNFVSGLKMHVNVFTANLCRRQQQK